jgi:hypothetical protein
MQANGDQGAVADLPGGRAGAAAPGLRARSKAPQLALHLGQQLGRTAAMDELGNWKEEKVSVRGGGDVKLG